MIEINRTACRPAIPSKRSVTFSSKNVFPTEAPKRSLRRMECCRVHASGRFVMRGVPPGDYKLFAWGSARPFAYQNAAFIAKDENRGRLIHVGQGNTVNAELTIIRLRRRSI